MKFCNYTKSLSGFFCFFFNDIVLRGHVRGSGVNIITDCDYRHLRPFSFLLMTAWSLALLRNMPVKGEHQSA